MWRRHQVDHLPEGELEVHLLKEDKTPEIAPSFSGRRHAGIEKRL